MHHDSDWNYVNRADQNRVPNLSRARFDYKRKDEDDMAKSTKTYEERIRALEKKEQESIEATKKLIAQRKELEKRKNCLLYTSPSPRDVEETRMPSSA